MFSGEGQRQVRDYCANLNNFCIHLAMFAQQIRAGFHVSWLRLSWNKTVVVLALARDDKRIASASGLAPLRRTALPTLYEEKAKKFFTSARNCHLRFFRDENTLPALQPLQNPPAMSVLKTWQKLIKYFSADEWSDASICFTIVDTIPLNTRLSIIKTPESRRKVASGRSARDRCEARTQIDVHR